MTRLYLSCEASLCSRRDPWRGWKLRVSDDSTFNSWAISPFLKCLGGWSMSPLHQFSDFQRVFAVVHNKKYLFYHYPGICTRACTHIYKENKSFTKYYFNICPCCMWYALIFSILICFVSVHSIFFYSPSLYKMLCIILLWFQDPLWNYKVRFEKYGIRLIEINQLMLSKYSSITGMC